MKKNVTMHQERAPATISYCSTDKRQHMVGHADPRTTRLCDCRHMNVSGNIVERIFI